MNSHFESLPNEILMDLFQYFDAQELFQAFYKLNIRFRILIQSFQHLKLVFYLKKINNNLITNDDIFPSFVYTLCVNSGINVNLNRFPNVRRLKLEWPSDQELQQLCSNVLRHLEQLTLVYIETFPTNDGSLCLPSLRILKVRFINLLIYQTILSSCPNLYYFQLAIFTSEDSSLNINTHDNLRQLIINVGDVVWPWNDYLLNKYLSCIPNLEQLNIHRLFYISRITNSFLNYDWLSSIISTHLRTLRRFRFYLRSFPAKNFNKSDTEKFLRQINESFMKFHNGQYQSRLIIEHS